MFCVVICRRWLTFCTITRRKCACAQQSGPKMALGVRALRVHFCASRHFLKTTAVYHQRHFSENVSSKSKASAEPADHILYTQEHFALKDSLRKVTVVAYPTIGNITFYLQALVHNILKFWGFFYVFSPTKKI